MPNLCEQLAQVWWSWSGAMFWQVSLLVVVIAVADLAVRRFAWPQIRYALWSLVLLKLVLPPTWTMPSAIVANLRPWLDRQVVERIVAPSPAQPPAGVAPGRDAMRGPEADEAAGGEVGAAGLPAEPDPSWAVLAAAVWLSGMLLMASLLWVRIATLRRWHRQQEERGTIPPWFHQLLLATAERLGLERLPAIVFSDKAVSPAVYGLLRPTLLLPKPYIDTLDRAEAEHVLLHELAHVKRGDLWVNAAWLVVQAVYWFNPFVAWARREAKHVREMCCDLTVANVLRERTPAYRSTLLNTARELLTESVEPGMGLLGVFEEPFRLVPRLRLLERNTWKHRRLAGVTSLLVGLLLVPVLLPMAAAEPQGGDPPVDRRSRLTRDLLADPAGGDVFVREVVREEFLLFGLPFRNTVLRYNSAWFGDGVLAVTEDRRTIILDAVRDRLLFIDHNATTYVEAPIPADPEDLLSPSALEHGTQRRTTGTVTDTGDSRRLLGRRCREYEVNMWLVWGRNAGKPYAIRVWATTDLPVDLDLFDRFLETARRLAGRDAELRRALRLIRGIQVRTEMAVETGLLTQKRYVAETVEIVRRPPPEGIYEPPPGYRRVSHIETVDP